MLQESERKFSVCKNGFCLHISVLLCKWLFREVQFSSSQLHASPRCRGHCLTLQEATLACLPAHAGSAVWLVAWRSLCGHTAEQSDWPGHGKQWDCCPAAFTCPLRGLAMPELPVSLRAVRTILLEGDTKPWPQARLCLCFLAPVHKCCSLYWHWASRAVLFLLNFVIKIPHGVFWQAEWIWNDWGIFSSFVRLHLQSNSRVPKGGQPGWGRALRGS